jgi:hypothetical protein
MPYIDQKERGVFEHEIEGSGRSLIECVGENIFDPGTFNYVVTRLAHMYLKVNGQNYQHYNDIIGALEGVKMELYRRHTAPYEDKKIEENGDV